MKKILFILMLIPGIGLSQSIGVDLGVNSTKITSGAKNGTFGSKTAPSFSLFYSKDLDKVNFKIGMGYSQIKSTYGSYSITDNSGNKISDVSNVASFDYLNIPFSANYTLLNKKVIAGIGLGMAGKIKINSNQSNASGFLLDFTPNAFVGFKVNKMSVLGNFIYGKGLMDINSAGNGYNYIGGFLTLKYLWQ